MPQSAPMSAADVLAAYGAPASASSSVPAPQGMTAQQVLETYGSAAPKKAQPSTMQALADKAKGAWRQMESGANAAWAGGVQGYNDVGKVIVPPVGSILDKIGATGAIRNVMQYAGASP